MNRKIFIIFDRYKFYLLIVSIALFFVSIIIQKFNERKLTANSVKKELEASLNDLETKFENVCDNTIFIEQLRNGLPISQEFLLDPFQISVFKNHDSTLLTWNNVEFEDNFKKQNTSWLSIDSTSINYHIEKVIIKNHDTFFVKALIKICTNQLLGNYLLPNIEIINKYYNPVVFKTNISVNNKYNKRLFYLQKKQYGFFEGYSVLVLILRVVSVFFLVYFINNTAKYIARKKGFITSICFLISTIVSIRTLSYFINFPFAYNKVPLFDPSIYASNFFHPSLGDLLINLILTFWVLSYFDTKKIYENITKALTKNIFLHCIFILLFISCSFLFMSILRSLIIDSQIPFNVGLVFQLNIYTLIAFLCICLAAVNYIKITKSIYVYIKETSSNFFLTVIITLIFIGIGIYINNYQAIYNLLFCLGIFLWHIIYLVSREIFFKKSNQTKHQGRAYSLFHIILFTATSSAITVYFSSKHDTDLNKKFAEKIYTEKVNLENLSLSKNKVDDKNYAIYVSGILVEQKGNYNFSKFFNPASQNEKHSELEVYKTDDNAYVLIDQNENYTLDFITLFAYLFFTFLLVYSILLLFIRLSNTNSNILNQYKKVLSSIRNQIRMTILIFSFVCFCSFGITAIYFYAQKFKNNNEKIIVNALNANQKIYNNSDTLSNDFLFSLQNLSIQLNQNILIYNKEGKLVKAFEKENRVKQSYTSFIDYFAYQALYKKSELFYKKLFNINDKNINFYYKPITNDSGEILGAIAIADFDYQQNLNQDLSGFIASLINITAFIILLSSIVTLFITNRITSSFTLISNKMKQISWRGGNDIIEWNRNDEIGVLVNEYNSLVKKLEATAYAFAQSQKEMAWKEMAKQVAHEIKNPLTPMKLSIQYLQSKIDADAPNIKQLSKTVAYTLIEQINQLSNIASDFSQFANIGNDTSEIICLNDIILGIVQLHSTSSSVEIEHNLNENKYNVFAPKNQLTRLFTNLFKNAIEASIEKPMALIKVDATLNENKIIISIEDNGTGIPEEVQQNIFTLNFTTKSSGTGLGLMICKGIVENANGKIWFTSSNEGTTFFIELPVYNEL